MARFALMAGLAVSPKAMGSEHALFRPQSAESPSAHQDDRPHVEALSSTRTAEAAPSSSPESNAEAALIGPPYTPEQRQGMLRLGQEMGEQVFDTLFGEDLAFAQGQANEPGIDPRSLFEMGFYQL